MNLELLNALENEVYKTEDGNLIKILEGSKVKLSKEHSSNIMFVSDRFGYNEIAGILKQEYGIKIDLSEYIDDNIPHMITYTYGKSSIESEQIAVNEMFSYDKITVPCKAKAISECDISVFISSDISRVPNDTFTEADEIILVSNAVMALSMQEKNWLKEISTVFDTGSISVALYNIGKLNTFDEKTELFENCKQILNKADGNITFLDDACEALIMIEPVITKKDNYAEKRRAVIVKCLIDELNKQSKVLLEACSVDLGVLNGQIEEIEKKRKDIEATGRMVVENSISNLYGELKNTIVASADEYNEGLYKSIRSRIETSSDLEKDIGHISAYLKHSWEIFSDKVNELAAEKNSKISETLASQIEADCEAISEMIDLSYIKCNLSDIDKISVNVNAHKAELEATINEKKIKKGVVAASIGLALFVNPIFIVPAFVVPSILKKRSASVDEIREKVLSELFPECVKIKNNVLKQIQESITETENEAKENIKGIYSQSIEGLIKTLETTVDKVSKAQNKKDIFENIVNSLLPKVADEI